MCLGENIYDPSGLAEEEEEDGRQGRPEERQGSLTPQLPVRAHLGELGALKLLQRLPFKLESHVFYPEGFSQSY